jgi:hypothetical protein
MDSLRVSSEYDCGSHKVYLNFWVTDFGGCDRVQIMVNMSMFGSDYVAAQLHWIRYTKGPAGSPGPPLFVCVFVLLDTAIVYFFNNGI